MIFRKLTQRLSFDLSRNPKRDALWFIVIFVLGLSFRLLPHPSNISPLAGLLFLASREIRSNLVLLILPLFVGFIGDLFLKTDASAFFVTAGFVLSAFLGRVLLQSSFSFLRLGAASLLSSLSFFVLSNFGVWFAGYLYSRDLSGLVQCFTLALPFFERSMLSDLVCSFGIFGLLVWVKRIRGENVQALERNSTGSN